MNYESELNGIYSNLLDQLLQHQELFHIQSTELNRRLLKRKMDVGHLLVIDPISRQPIIVGKTLKTVKLKQPSVKADLLCNYLIETLEQGMIGNYASRGVNRFKVLKQHDFGSEHTRDFYDKKLSRLIAILRQEISYLNDQYEAYVAYKQSKNKFFFIVNEEDEVEADKYGNILLMELECSTKSYLDKVKDIIENVNDTMLMYLKSPQKEEAFDADKVVSGIFGTSKKDVK